MRDKYFEIATDKKKEISIVSEDDYESDDGQEDSFTVEAILNHKMENGKKYYWIKWEGYGEDQNTWEPIEHLQNVLGMVKRYEENNSKEIKEDINNKNGKHKQVLMLESPKRKKNKVDFKNKDTLIEVEEENTYSKPNTTITINESKIQEEVIQKEVQNDIPKITENIINKESSVEDKKLESNSNKENIQDQKDPTQIKKKQNRKKKTKFGSFRSRDKPARILSIKPYKKGFNFLVEWEKRIDGIKPENSHVTNEEMKAHAPGFLIDFYESKIVVISKKKQDKNDVKEEKEDKEDKEEVLNENTYEIKGGE